MIALFIALAKLLWHQFLEGDRLSSTQHGWEAEVQEQLQSLFSFYPGAISLRFRDDAIATYTSNYQVQRMVCFRVMSIVRT